MSVSLQLMNPAMKAFRWIKLLTTGSWYIIEMDDDVAHSLEFMSIEDAGANSSSLNLETNGELEENTQELRSSPDATSFKWADTDAPRSLHDTEIDESHTNLPDMSGNMPTIACTNGEAVDLPELNSSWSQLLTLSDDAEAKTTIDISHQDEHDLFADVDAVLNAETSEKSKTPILTETEVTPDASKSESETATESQSAHVERSESTTAASVEFTNSEAAPLELVNSPTSENIIPNTVEHRLPDATLVSVIPDEQNVPVELQSAEPLDMSASKPASAKIVEETSSVADATESTDKPGTPTAEVNYIETSESNTQETQAIHASSSAEDEGPDTFMDNAYQSRSIKWMNSSTPDASLQIEVEEEEVAVHIPFTPKKETVPSNSFGAFGDSPVNSNTTTPFAKVLPLTPPRSAPLSAQNSHNSNHSFGSPEMLHLPDIASSRNSFAHSSKLSARPVSQENKSRSQSMKSAFPSPSASFSQFEAPPLVMAPLAPALFNLDSTLSPSAKFRSFIKSLQPVKSESGEEGGDMAGVDLMTGGVSIKMSAGSTKEVQARIAKVQAEQERFRQTEKLKRSMMNVSKRISFANTSSKDLGPKKPTLKVNKNGAAQNFNANSIRAGLSRQEFRDTLEVGSAIVHRSPDKEETAHTEAKDKMLNTLKLFQREHHDDQQYENHPVTRSGEGYMSEADWKITVKDKYGSPKTKKSTKRSTPLSHREGLALQRANSMSTNSNLSLDQFIESALREQASKHTDSADCPGEPDVPLCYLQSAHLIDRRFGWDSKDHSVVKHDKPKLKSWMTLRAVVQSTGAFHLIAAAAAPPMNDNPTEARNKLMQPEKNAPYIVQEALPVTELIANLNKNRPRAASPDSAVHAGAQGLTDRPFTAPGDRVRTPHFSIAKQIPQRLSPDRKISPPAPRLKALTKEEAKSIKIKANTKEFHDRYNGLIFRDSSRDLTWHDTEEMILGTVRPRKNELLLHRGDMRWAGKTLNMFRPWSAAREMDAMDKFRLKRADTVQSKNLSISKPGTPGNTAPGSPSSVMRGKETSPGNSVNPTDRMLKRHNSKGSMHATHPVQQQTKGSSASHGSVSKTSRTAQKHRGAGAGSVGGGSVSGNSVTSGGIPASVTFAVSPAHHDLSDNASAYTLSSNMHSRASHSKRAPLLINVVKPLPPIHSPSISHA